MPVLAPRWLHWHNRVHLLVDKDVHKNDLIERGVTVDDLIAAQYTLVDLRKQNFAWTDLMDKMKFQPKHILQAPFDEYLQLVFLGTGLMVSDNEEELPRTPNADDWVNWQITPLFFMQHGVSISQFAALGFKAEHFYNHNVTVNDIKVQDCSAADWALVGIGEQELRTYWQFQAPDFTQLQLRQQGWGHVKTGIELFDPRKQEMQEQQQQQQQRPYRTARPLLLPLPIGARAMGAYLSSEGKTL